jgi:hypothetical protein
MVNLFALEPTRPVNVPPLVPPALVNVPAFLQQTRSQYQWSPTAFVGVQPRFLYIDRRTDAEVDISGTQSGYVEAPAGSGTYYRIIDVQDIDRGLPDEERRVVMIPQVFPSPLP